MGRTRWKVTIEAIDKVTSVIAHIGSTVRGVAGRAWSFAVSVVDKVTAPVKSMMPFFLLLRPKVLMMLLTLFFSLSLNP